MIRVNLFAGCKPIPFIEHEIEVSCDGDLVDENGKSISLDDFNAVTGLSVKTVEALVAVTFHSFNWPPAYWSQLNVLFHIDGTVSPENLVISLTKPVESKEFPGFYLIPYFSNYVISKSGVVIKKSDGRLIQASQNTLGYYTLRLTDDSGRCQNHLRHRVLCYAFKPYPVDVDTLDVNHKNGIPGDDDLENLEWATRSENIDHAYQNGLRSDNKDVEIKDVNTGKVFVFASCSQAGRSLDVTATTVSNRAKSNGHKVYNGFQFRFASPNLPWPVVESSGMFLVEFDDGTTKQCDGVEAARLAGVTRTSLLRMLREGRHYGKTRNRVSKIRNNSPVVG